MQSMPEKTRPASPRSKQWEWGLCLVLLAATMLNYANRQVLPISATRMMQELGLSNEEYGKIEAVFGLAFGTGALLGGCVADWIKIRWLYPSLMILWSMAGLMTGQANTFAAIWSCRLCLGLFEAGHWPCALRTTQRVFAPSRRPLANSILQSGAPLGAILPSLLMLIAVTDQDGSWQKIFWMVGILGLPWAIGWLLLVRTQDLQHPVLQTNESASSGSAPIHEIPFHRILISRRYWILIAIILCINTCWHYIRVWMPLALENNLGYSSDEVQQVMIGYWISTFMGSLFSGFLLNYLVAQGYSIHRARLTGFTGFSLLTSLAAVAAFLTPGLLFICLMLVIGFASLGLFPIYYSLNQELSAKNQGKVGGSLGFTTWVVLYFFHPWIGQIMDHNPSLRPYIFASVGLLPLAASVLLVFLWNQNNTRQPMSP